VLWLWISPLHPAVVGMCPFFFLFLVSFGLCLENISWLCVLCML
jgi:hypothetical protein